MGQIYISLSGSFDLQKSMIFSAMHGGHSGAVAEAIDWLAHEILPKAIEQDHRLQAEGQQPTLGFGARLLPVQGNDYLTPILRAVEVLYETQCGKFTNREKEEAVEAVVKAWDEMLE